MTQAAVSQNLAEYQGVWVFIEHVAGVPETVSFEILGKARELADTLHTTLTGLLLGVNLDSLARAVIARGADAVLMVESPLLETYSTEPYAKAVAQLVQQRKPSILLLGSTYDGRDLAGRLAVRLHTGLIANVVRLEIEKASELLLGAVPGFGGSILAICKCESSRPQMATVRPGIFRALEPDPTRSGRIERVPVELSETDLKTRILEKSLRSGVDVTKAALMVIVGMGTGGDLSLPKKLADLMGATIGVTRPLADKGLISRDYQIGSTGYSVKPKLALVLGASGAAHFVSGIDDSKLIISINTDPNAEIFQHSDYCVVDDLFKVLPLLIQELENQTATKGPS